MTKPHIRARAHDTPEVMQRRVRLAMMAAETAITEMETAEQDRWTDEPVSAGRRSTPTDDAYPIMASSRVQTRYAGSQSDADRAGFADFADFLNTVRAAAPSDDGGTGAAQIKAKTRLYNAALSTYGNEGVGQDGGYAVPADFRTAIASKVDGEESLAALCDRIPISSNTLNVPKDETAPWLADTGTNGIRAFWTGEAQVMQQSNLKLEDSTLKLHKLTTLVPLTDELLEDAPALAAHVTKKAGENIVQTLNRAIITGSGAGQPLGILNSGALITQGKETSQVADTIHGLNLLKMWARMSPAWRRDAVWLVNPDVVPQLMRAGLQTVSADGVTTVGGSLLWIPGGSVANQPYDTILGKRVIFTEECAALGDLGDIVFADLSQYAFLEREGGIQASQSIHIWFDQGVTAFKFQIRVAGQPWWSAPLADKNGSTTRSPFIALEAR